MINFNDIMTKAISHKSRIENTAKDYNDNLLKIKRTSDDLKLTSDSFKYSELAYEYLERKINAKSERFIKSIQNLLSFGLKAIFHDRDYGIDIRVADNNTASIHLTYTDLETGLPVDSDIKNDAGGVRTVIGVLLQIFFINHYKAEPILFVDEGFSAISSSYLPNFMGFLEELCDTKDFKILLVTHDNRIIPYANKVYQIKDHKSHLLRSKPLGQVTTQDVTGDESE